MAMVLKDRKEKTREKPEWRVLFPDKDISTMPFGDILKSLPQENNEL